MSGKDLYKLKHSQQDMFVADIVDARLKDDLHTMEHQIYNLSTKKLVVPFRYEHNGNVFEVKPSTDGIPFIGDKDILIYCASQLAAAINKKKTPKRTIRLSVHSYLITTNRGKGGKGYIDFVDSLDRLYGTHIKTDIQTNNERIIEPFRIIENYKIIEKTKNASRDKKGAVTVDITLSKWQYNAILAGELLTLNKDYFRLRSPINKALYLHARKHCGHQGKYNISLDKLKKKIGIRSELKEFRRHIRAVCVKGAILEYEINHDSEKDMVTFYNTSKKGLIAKSKDMLEAIDKDLIKNMTSDCIISKEEIDRAENVYKKLIKEGADELIARNIRDKMLRKD